jgi:AraC-like DNA-binding protein
MIYTSLFINLFMCLLLLNFQWREQKAILYLCLILIIFNKRQITELLLNSDSDGIVLTQIIFLTDPIGYLIGPLTLYYFKSLVAKKFVINYRLIWLCLPSLLIAINMWPYYQFSFKERFEIVMAIKNHVFVQDFPKSQTLFFSFKMQELFLMISNSLFVIYSFYFVFKSNNENSQNQKNVKLIYSTISIFIISILPILLFVVYTFFSMPGNFSFGYVLPANFYTNYQYLITLIPPLSFLFFPKLIYGLKQNGSVINRLKEIIGDFYDKKKDKIIEEQVVSTEKDLILDYITKKKPYLNPTFSMHTISKDLNIPHLRVSRCFNKEMKISFPEFRKRKRVEYAIELFKVGAHEKMSIEGVSAQSGFKNKSSFFLAFQSEFKMTPSEWISKNL